MWRPVLPTSSLILPRTLGWRELHGAQQHQSLGGGTPGPLQTHHLPRLSAPQYQAGGGLLEHTGVLYPLRMCAGDLGTCRLSSGQSSALTGSTNTY